jgi:glucose-1-phosphate thymidylyltransferase
MNIIIPMAGMGKRMRPHTLTTPKPLLPIAGKPIVQRLVEDIVAVCNEDIKEVAFIIGEHFGAEVEEQLKMIAKNVGATGVICYQTEALGTAHAVYCAKAQLQGPVIVAFADTLFRADFKIDSSSDGVIWVKSVEDPRAFGVVKLDENNTITDFVEKPDEFVSDLAIIGIYYFKSGETLKTEIQYLLDNDIKDKGEYQLTNALENMKNKNMKFVPGEVQEWMDCGNKNATVHTNQRVLANSNGTPLIDTSAVLENAEIIKPCYIGKNVNLKNVKIGPYVSIGDNSSIKDSVISNSIIQTNVEIKNANITNSMIGNFAIYNGDSNELSIGDFSSQN